MFSMHAFILLVTCVQLCVIADVDNSPTKLLSRRKRYVAFPDGSSFSIAGCIAVGLIGQPAPSSAPGTYSFGLNWAIAYELPNATETTAYYLQKRYYKHKSVQKRRNRRDLYEKLEVILNDMGYHGRQCILKTLCETTQRIVPHSTNMLDEIFRTIFTLPLTKIAATEPIEHAMYSSAHRLGAILQNCDKMFKCPISLVDWAKGYYDTPSPTIGKQRSPWALFSNTFG